MVKPRLGRFDTFQASAKPTPPDPGTLVRRACVGEGGRLPLVLEPALDGVDLVTWAGGCRDALEADLHASGAILFRGFQLEASRIEAFVEAVSGRALDYTERSSPRHRVEGHVYTSTDYPADQSIFFHNENSYAHTWPLKLFFFCVTPADEGGDTPLADVRRVYARLDADIRARFERTGVLYVRNFRQGLGLDWRTVFQVDDPRDATERARANGYEAEWRADNHLRTRRVGPAVLHHPRTRESLWFNHAAFFHVSTLPPALQAELRALGEEHPHQTYYGDGTPIPNDVVAAVRAAYEAESCSFSWRAGDLLMVDNMLVAHARGPFRGPRDVRVAMADPYSLTAAGGNGRQVDGSG